MLGEPSGHPFNRTRRNWNTIRFLNIFAGLLLLIAPEGIEIKYKHLLREGFKLLIAPEGIEIYLLTFDQQNHHHSLNRTRRNWNIALFTFLLLNALLLIAPEGIEMQMLIIIVPIPFTLNRTRRNWNIVAHNQKWLLSCS